MEELPDDGAAWRCCFAMTEGGHWRCPQPAVGLLDESTAAGAGEAVRTTYRAVHLHGRAFCALHGGMVEDMAGLRG